MYEDYWQLESKPFEPGDTGAYFACESHEGTTLKLRYAIEQRRAAAALAGPSGVGKTMLVQRILNDLPEEFSPRVQLVFPQMSDRELLSYLAEELGAPMLGETNRGSVEESVRRLQKFFAANQADGKHAVVVIDEAQLLEDSGSLETLRLLLNFGGASAPFTLLLVGQMGLLSSVARRPALEERLAVRSLVRSFTPTETAEYVQHRLKQAGATREIFNALAIEALHDATGGIPRRIDRLGDLALVVGYANGLPVIGPEQIESVQQELVAVTPE